MEFLSQMDPDLKAWVVVPLLIFLARILDVSIGTLRIVFISRGAKTLAPLLGFFEVLIWLVAMSQIMQNLDNVVSYLSWAAGFAVGNYVGLYIEEKLALGNLMVRIITQKPADDLILNLRQAGFGVTSLDAKGTQGDVNVIFTLFQRKDMDHVMEVVKTYNPNAFYTIETVRYSSGQVFPAIRQGLPRVGK